MRLEKWFISNLDDSQRKIIVQSIDDDIIVQGAAGSGKTNLAIHRALQAKGKGSYAIVIFTVALKRMIAYGMQALGLDKERIAYEWAWTHRGFDLTGDVYCERINPNILYYNNGTVIQEFIRTEKNDETTYGLKFANRERGEYKMFYDAFGSVSHWLKGKKYNQTYITQQPEMGIIKIPCGIMTYRDSDLTGKVFCREINPNILYLVNDTNVRKFIRTERSETTYGLDFADWVADCFYRNFGRRVSWFKEENSHVSGFSVTNSEKYILIPSGTMYKQSENKIDYLIIDEAQDFNVSDYQGRISAHKGKSLSLFGDTVQQMNFKGSSIEAIANVLGYKRFSLDYNYRLPKSIAKVAQQLQDVKVDLLTNNLKDGGNSDFPNYPKPMITKFSSREKELEGIVNRIKMEDLDDVAILVPDETDVREVNKYLNDRGIQTQVHYRTGNVVPFHTINTLDFSNNDLPCILTYYAAKGSEFDNVFVPFANEANDCKRNSFYVACTRSSRNLYISYK